MWTVAMIDDDFQVIEAMKKMIPWEQLGAELVGVALDGEEGLQIIQEHAPDIVITDIYMPVMNGMQMIELLREENFMGKLIILSGFSHFEIAQSAIRLDVQDYLVKPVTLDELTASMKKAIDQLQKSIEQNMAYADMKEKLMLYEPFVAKETIIAMLTGSSKGTTAIKPGSEEWWTDRQFVVIAFELQRTRRVMNISVSDWSLFRFAISNVIEETSAEHWIESHNVELHGPYWAVLLHVDQGIEDVQGRIEQLINVITDNVLNSIQLKLSSGIGQLKASDKDIHLSMEEAFQNLYNQSAAGNKDPLHDQALSALSFQTFKFYQDLYQNFLEMDQEKIMDCVNSHLLHLSGHQLKIQYYQSFAQDILDFFRLTLDQSTRMFLDIDENRWDCEVSSIQNLQQLDNWLQTILMSIFERKYLEVNVQHKQVVDFMIQYIHENYSEELQLDTLSKELYLTKNYLSQIFKKALGETFSNYLTKVRIERAKKMIKEGKFLIYEISEMVGYKNVRYFSTLFKKYTGINPSDFSNH